MARERAIDLTALDEGTRPEHDRVPSPRFPSWEELGLQGTAPTGAATAPVAAPQPRRRDLRRSTPAAAAPPATAATTRWDSPPQPATERSWYDDDSAAHTQHLQRGARSPHTHDGEFGDHGSYDAYGSADAYDSYAQLPAPARTGAAVNGAPRSAGQPVSYELPRPVGPELELAHEAYDDEDDDLTPSRQRPPVLTWLLVVAALVLTGMVGYLLGSNGQTAELTAARTAVAEAQQAQHAAEKQLEDVQHAPADAAAAAAQDAEAKVAEAAKPAASAVATAKAKASAAPSASAEPATADAAGVTGAGSAAAPSASKAPTSDAGSGSGTGSGSDAGADQGAGDSGSIGSDPAAPAAAPMG